MVLLALDAPDGAALVDIGAAFRSTGNALPAFERDSASKASKLKASGSWGRRRNQYGHYPSSIIKISSIKGYMKTNSANKELGLLCASVWQGPAHTQHPNPPWITYMTPQVSWSRWPPLRDDQDLNVQHITSCWLQVLQATWKQDLLLEALLSWSMLGLNWTPKSQGVSKLPYPALNPSNTISTTYGVKSDSLINNRLFDRKNEIDNIKCGERLKRSIVRTSLHSGTGINTGFACLLQNSPRSPNRGLAEWWS